MEVLYTSKKGRMLNTMERFYIYAETLKKNQINDRHTVRQNAIFDAILHDSTT
jgi:hypothetical protein